MTRDQLAGCDRDQRPQWRAAHRYDTLIAGMRCAICGTENAPDSRFCGGCGARVSGVSNRLAPTVKVAVQVERALPLWGAPAKPGPYDANKNTARERTG